MTMDQAQATELKANFDRDGFVILRKFVPEVQLNEICQRAEVAISKKPNSGGMFTNITKGLEKVDDYFADLLMNGAHVPILEMLMGRKPEPTTASFFTKDKNSEEVHPHSDALDGGVIWVAIDETNKENGCLHFLKGSHLREDEFTHLKAHEATDLADHPDLVEVAMNRGDIVFFKPTTVHCSGPNHSGTTRRGFNCFYVGDPFKGKGKQDFTTEEWAAIKKKKLKLAGKSSA
jgi:ectoine hydroxylase-related dioxygenase (phytanoyl-CoA dioxygenase family)